MSPSASVTEPTDSAYAGVRIVVVVDRWWWWWW
jgi:hypothetical protein